MVSIVCIAIYLLVIFLFPRLYCRLTVGRCHSQQCMSGKTVLITGATAGIGKVTALNLAQRNARVILACRNLEKGEKVKSEIIGATGNSNVAVKHLDLASFDSVRKCAEDVLKTEKRLDVLINNAGIGEIGGELTKDGCEKVMQVNYFGHFLLTLMLLDLLKKSKPSRIVNVSSLLFFCAVLDMEDINGFKDSSLLRKIGSHYCRSKWADILFTVELARRLDGQGVTVNCLHPGLVETDIFDNSRHAAAKILRFFSTLLGKSTEEGAQTSIYLAVDPDLQNVTGKFFSDCGISMLLWLRTPSEMLARKFFELSEEAVGVTLKSQ